MNSFDVPSPEVTERATVAAARPSGRPRLSTPQRFAATALLALGLLGVGGVALVQAADPTPSASTSTTTTQTTTQSTNTGTNTHAGSMTHSGNCPNMGSNSSTSSTSSSSSSSN